MSQSVNENEDSSSIKSTDDLKAFIESIMDNNLKEECSDPERLTSKTKSLEAEIISVDGLDPLANSEASSSSVEDYSRLRFYDFEMDMDDQGAKDLRTPMAGAVEEKRGGDGTVLDLEKDRGSKS